MWITWFYVGVMFYLLIEGFLAERLNPTDGYFYSL
jgi:hypothetical protein